MILLNAQQVCWRLHALRLRGERGKDGKVESTEVMHRLYEALASGDIPGLSARISPEVVVDEPPALPYGGVTRGRDNFLESVLGTMAALAAIEISDYAVFEGATGAVGKVVGTLTARASGEKFPLTMIELHEEITGGETAKIDVYVKDPAALAAFYERASAAAK